ncbi:MAG: carbohydrate-binding domain-containing protein [Lachnospiraceae bacterium]|nr:carbohydrate-binding domain-containing protein [Lachnospiraceae bacterium]
MKRTAGCKSTAAAVCAALFLTACAGESPAAGEARPETAWQAAFAITREDQKTEPEQPREVQLPVETGTFLITEGGEYLLFGSMEGQIIVDACEDELVHLYLAGVSVTSPQGPAIRIEEASKVVVTLVSETENVLTDSPDYTGYEDTEGCLYSAADLTINGGGSLSVIGYHEDGIRSRDVVKILDVSVNVQAKGDGIRGNDGVAVKNSQIRIESEGSGIRTTRQGESARGVIEIDGGTLQLVAGKNGIWSVSDLHMQDCRCTINAVEEKTRIEGRNAIEEGCMN